MTRQRRDPFAGADVCALWVKVCSRIEVTEAGCWLWQGAVNSRGYGCVSTGTGTSGLVHRLAVIVRDGAISPGLQVDHRCHDARCHELPCPHRLCVNPDHLSPVTPGANMRRQHEGFRCKHGHPLTTRRDGPRRCVTCAQTYDLAYAGPGSTAQPGPYDVPLFEWSPTVTSSPGLPEATDNATAHPDLDRAEQFDPHIVPMLWAARRENA